MPAAHPSSNPFRNRRMIQAAHDGMIITLRCTKCRRVVHFWAADLIEVVGPDHQVHLPPFGCSRCRTKEWVEMAWRIPTADFLIGLTVRRPVRKIEKWLWRNERA